MGHPPATPKAWIVTIANAAVLALAGPGPAPAEVQRLLDGGATLRPGGGPASGRVTGLHVSRGASRSLFLRGLTLRRDEGVRFDLPPRPGPATLQWFARPAGGLSVLVDGRRLDGSPVRIDAESRRVELFADAGTVTLGEPLLAIATPTPLPDVLLVTVDTWRRDAFSCHGAPETVTPRLADFAGECVGFDDAIAPASWTIPAFIGMFTGRHPLALGATGRDAAIPDSVATLAELLAARGYHTRAIPQNTMLSPDAGFARGFDVYDFYGSSSVQTRPAARVTDLAIAWMTRAAATPAFLWVHYFEPHGDYAPPEEDVRAVAPGTDARPFEVPGPRDAKRIHAVATEPGALARARALYDAEVRVVDREIGRLVDAWRALGRLDRSLVVVTSDHGEEFLEHGRLGHGHGLGDEQLRVPLLVRFPGGRGAGGRVSGQVTLVDLAPTILEAAGVTAPAADGPASLRGRSLLAAAAGAEIGSRPEIALATLFPELDEPAVCVRDGRRKLVYRAGADRAECWFDLTKDPGERRPRALPAPGPDVRIPWPEPVPLTADASRGRAEQLRTLGYLD